MKVDARQACKYLMLTRKKSKTFTVLKTKKFALARKCFVKITLWLACDLESFNLKALSNWFHGIFAKKCMSNLLKLPHCGLFSLAFFSLKRLTLYVYGWIDAKLDNYLKFNTDKVLDIV